MKFGADRKVVLYQSVTGSIVFKVFIPATWGILLNRFPKFYVAGYHNIESHNRELIKHGRTN